jgi:hypothetical protein
MLGIPNLPIRLRSRFGFVNFAAAPFRGARRTSILREASEAGRNRGHRLGERALGVIEDTAVAVPSGTRPVIEDAGVTEGLSRLDSAVLLVGLVALQLAWFALVAYALFTLAA